MTGGGSTIRGAVLEDAPGKLALADLLLDERLEPDEVRVRIVACGLCHSDLHMLEGDLPTQTPTVPGHELAGVVEEVGPAVVDLSPGDHVVACLSMFCGACDECAVGRTWLCRRRNELGWPDRSRPRLSRNGEPVGQVAGLGGLAEQGIVHRSALVRVPRELPLDRAALLGCAVMTGVGSAVNGAQVRPGETVAVIGCGGVGLNIVQGARIAGAARIVAIDRSADGLALAERLGATDLVHADGARDPVADVHALLRAGVDHAFDVVGVSATTAQAVAMVRAGRTAWLVGLPAAGSTLELPGLHLLTQAKGVQGLLMGSNRFRRDIPMLADLALQGRLDLDALVTSVLPLEKANDGFDLMRGGGAGRVVIGLE